MSDLETVDALAGGTRLNQWYYDLLLQYLNTMGMGYHSAYKITLHVRGALILPPFTLLPQIGMGYLTILACFEWIMLNL